MKSQTIALGTYAVMALAPCRSVAARSYIHHSETTGSVDITNYYICFHDSEVRI